MGQPFVELRDFHLLQSFEHTLSNFEEVILIAGNSFQDFVN